MESNKEESLRCIDIAISKFDNNNYEAGFKFLKKSIALYPNEKAKELEQFYLKKQESTSNTSGSSNSNGGSSTSNVNSSNTSKTTSEESNTPTYTVEQVAAIKKIKASKNFYEVLEVSKTATDVEIKKSYRKIALQLHPDKNHAPGAEDAFKMVTQAFSCLSDKRKRETYDLHGSEDTPVNRSPFQRGGGVYYDENISPEDIFENFFGFPFGQNAHPGGHVRRRGNSHFNFYTSSPFDSGFNFQQGGGFRRRPNRTAQQEETNFSSLLVFIPLILIFLSMLFGGESGPSMEQKLQLFHLNPNTKTGYTVERVIEVKNNYVFTIYYYVKDNFDKQLQSLNLKLSSLEDVVVDKWIKQKRYDCVEKNRVEERLKYAKDKKLSEDIKKYEKMLKDSKFQYCEELKSYFHL